MLPASIVLKGKALRSNRYVDHAAEQGITDMMVPPTSEAAKQASVDSKSFGGYLHRGYSGR